MADPNPFPNMTLIHRPPKAQVARIVAGILGLVAIVALAVSNVITAQAVRDAQNTANNIEQASTCRFDATAEISDANDALDLWTWIGLKAAVQGTDSEFQHAIEEGDRAANRLKVKYQGRSEIVEDCDAVSK